MAETEPRWLAGITPEVRERLAALLASPWPADKPHDLVRVCEEAVLRPWRGAGASTGPAARGPIVIERREDRPRWPRA
jgi:hypothetical protein